MSQGYSYVRTDEQHGTRPVITTQYNEVIISITPVWDSAMNNTRWFICYGIPYSDISAPAPTPASGIERQLQININNLQYRVNDLQYENDQYFKYTQVLNNFIDESGLRSTFERKIQEEQIKKELTMSIGAPPPTEVCVDEVDSSSM